MNLQFAPYLRLIADRVIGTWHHCLHGSTDAASCKYTVTAPALELHLLVLQSGSMMYATLHIAEDFLEQHSATRFNGMHLRIEADAIQV